MVTNIVSIKGREFLDYLSNNLILKDSAPWH